MVYYANGYSVKLKKKLNIIARRHLFYWLLILDYLDNRGNTTTITTPLRNVLQSQWFINALGTKTFVTLLSIKSSLSAKTCHIIFQTKHERVKYHNLNIWKTRAGIASYWKKSRVTNARRKHTAGHFLHGQRKQKNRPVKKYTPKRYFRWCSA